MRIGGILSFLILLTFSVVLFIYSAYILIDGRRMEKEYEGLTLMIKNEEVFYGDKLIELWITSYEKKAFAVQYKNDIYVYITFVCYASTDNPNYEPETIQWILDNNAQCIAKWIPENTLRSEVELVFKNWAAFKMPIDQKLKELDSKYYASLFDKGKLDVGIVNQLTLVSIIGMFLSAALYYFLEYTKKMHKRVYAPRDATKRKYTKRIPKKPKRKSVDVE